MQKFAIVTCKHNSMPEVMKLVKQSLDAIAADPQTRHFVIHSFAITPGFEMPDSKVARLDGQVAQPQMVNYVNILLVSSTPAGGVGALPDQAAVTPLSADDLVEIEKIKKSKALLCKHVNLLPEKLYKGYRGPDHWYQVCADCGAEIWNGTLQDHFNQKVVNGKLEYYEIDPLQCEHEHLDSKVFQGKDKGGHDALYKLCTDCGANIYQGVPGMPINIDPIGDQVNQLP